MKKALSLILSLIIAFSVISYSGITSFAADLSGECGDGVVWEYNSQQKSLLITGDGYMDEYYDNPSDRPWESVADEIETVSFGIGVLSVGAYAFADCENIKIIGFSETVSVIGENAFAGCTGLRYTDTGFCVVAIGPSAFENCTNLSLIEVSKETVYIGNNAFKGCPLDMVIYRGLPEELDYIYYENESQMFDNVICADTIYDLCIEQDWQDEITVISFVPFSFYMDENDSAVIIGAQYDTIVEDGVEYYIGTATIYGKDTGRAVVYALNEDDYVLDTFSVIVGCNQYNHHGFSEPKKCREGTCMDMGFDTETCYHCGHVQTTNIEYGDHVPDTYKTVKEATCTQAGLKTAQCVLCDAIIEEEIPMTSHTFGKWEIILEPTEEMEGEKEHECTTCGKKETVKIPMLSSVMGDINGDGMVTAIDARLVLQHVAGLRELDENPLVLADMNGDGKVSAVDARYILRIVAGILDQ